MSRYALITGASSGIGLALAEALAQQGRALILVARERVALESIACELRQRFNVEVLFRQCDLAEPLHISGLLHELTQTDYRIDLLINNAGVACGGAFLEHEWQQERRLMELNMVAVARLCHALGQRMAQQGQGQILNVASVAAFQPGPWMSSYYASKAFVLHFSEGLREELAPLGVKVSVLCPGPIATPFWQRASLSVRRVPAPWLMPTDQLAQLTLQALSRNQAVIVPSWRHRWLGRAVRMLPRGLVRTVMANINRKLLP